MVKPVDEYTEGESYIEGEEICPVCTRFWLPLRKYEPVVLQNGVRYQTILDVNPGNAPYFCEECFKKAKAEQRKRENESLEAF